MHTPSALHANTMHPSKHRPEMIVSAGARIPGVAGGDVWSCSKPPVLCNTVLPSCGVVAAMELLELAWLFEASRMAWSVGTTAVSLSFRFGLDMSLRRAYRQGNGSYVECTYLKDVYNYTSRIQPT